MLTYISQRYDENGDPQGEPRTYTEEAAPANVKRALSKPQFVSVEYHYKDGCSIEWRIAK